jgi:hypothetical protein
MIGKIKDYYVERGFRAEPHLGQGGSPQRLRQIRKCGREGYPAQYAKPLPESVRYI